MPRRPLYRSLLIDLKKKALSIAKLLENFKILKIKGEANSVAHELALFSFDNRGRADVLSLIIYCPAWKNV